MGEGGYQVGNFPVRWAEWNGRYRDAVRALLAGRRRQGRGDRLSAHRQQRPVRGERAQALGQHQPHHGARRLHAAATWSATNEKHNEANGENNQDGNNHEHSWNCGVEGPTRRPGRQTRCAGASGATCSPRCCSRRARRCWWPATSSGARSAATTTPTVRTTSSAGSTGAGATSSARCLEFTKRLLAHPARAPCAAPLQVLSGSRHPRHRSAGPGLVPPRRQRDVERGLGQPGTPAAWRMFLAGRGIDDVDEQGRPLVDDNLLLLINASEQRPHVHDPRRCRRVREPWQLLLDTADDARRRARCPASSTTRCSARSLKFFRAPSRVHPRGWLGAHARRHLSPAAATPAFGFRRRVQPSPTTCASSASPTSTRSPIFAAGPGSTHGYDVVDHARLNPELGGEAGLHGVQRGAQRARLGLLLDWVPNHMGIAVGQNRLWDDVLENGPSSLLRGVLRHRLESVAPETCETACCLPILGDQYGEVLERGELQRRAGKADSFKLALLRAQAAARPEDAAAAARVASLHTSWAGARTARGAASSRASLRRCATCPSATRLARDERKRARAREGGHQAALRAPGARAGRRAQRARRGAGRAQRHRRASPASFDALDRLLAQQSYRLASWRVAFEEINYRRFFDINELAAVRMELPQRVRAGARAALSSDRRGTGQGAPARPHRRSLRSSWRTSRRCSIAFRRSCAPGDERPAPTTWRARCRSWSRRSSSRASSCPPRWPVDGTTGYEFADRARRPVGRPARRARADASCTCASPATGAPSRSTSTRASSHVLRFSFASEVNMLARALRAHRQPEPQLARLHARRPDARADRDHRGLSRVSHLPARGRAARRAALGCRPAARARRDRARAPSHAEQQCDHLFDSSRSCCC